MGMKYKEVGGGPATGLANDFVSFLQNGMNTGSFGGGSAAGQAGAANPMGDTMGIAGVLNDILSGGAGKIGGSMMDMISKQGDRDAMALRARFGVGGGSAFGTPAAYAESVLRSETAPKMTQAIGGLQMNALSQLLPILMGMSQKGITQREGTMSASPWMQAAQIGLPIAGSVLGMMAGGPMGAGMGASMGSSMGGMFGGSVMDKAPAPSFNPAAFNATQFGYTPSMMFA